MYVCVIVIACVRSCVCVRLIRRPPTLACWFEDSFLLTPRARGSPVWLLFVMNYACLLFACADNPADNHGNRLDMRTQSNVSGAHDRRTSREADSRQYAVAFLNRSQSSASHQLVLLPHSIAECEEVVWGRRHAKRSAGVDAVKRSADYMCLIDRAIQPRPTTPDPLDRQVSKRRWERSVQAWRANIANAVAEYEAAQLN